MNILLVEPKTTSIAYNLALLKWARYCVDNGHDYQYVRGIVPHADRMVGCNVARKFWDYESDFTIVPDRIYMSCIFSFYSKKYENTIDHYLKMFPTTDIYVGGVFPSLTPEWFDKHKWSGGAFNDPRVYVHQGRHASIEHLVPKYDCYVIDEDMISGTAAQKDKVLIKRKKIVLYTSRGCVNKCGYCAVPKLEGDQVNFPTIRPYLEAAKKEIPDATSVVLYDNNFTEQTNVTQIIDELVDSDYSVDIHGLHVESFTPEFAKDISRLKFKAQGDHGTPYMRFSFDKMKYEPSVWKAMETFTKAGIKAEFFCYMLYNWIDSPADFWKRIIVSHNIARTYNRNIFLFPQRYEPFQALEKYGYVGRHWTPEFAKGVRIMSTWLHGFITCSPSLNIFNWLGYTLEEFEERCLEMVDTRHLDKKDEKIPDFQFFLDQIKE